MPKRQQNLHFQWSRNTKIVLKLEKKTKNQKQDNERKEEEQ